MSLEQDDYFKYESQHQALRLAVRIFGGAQALCDAVNKRLKASEEKLSRECLNHWKNHHQKITLSFAIIISKLTGIPIHDLAPFYITPNEIMTENQGLLQWPLEKIIVRPSFYDPMTRIHTSILIDTEGVLISGLETLKAYQTQNKQTIPAVVLDVKKLFNTLEDRRFHSFGFSLVSFDCLFTISQKAAISLRLDEFAKNNDLSSIDFNLNRCVAKLLDFESEALLLLAKKIYLKAPLFFIEAVDAQKISLTAMDQLIEKPTFLKEFRSAERNFLKKYFF